MLAVPFIALASTFAFALVEAAPLAVRNTEIICKDPLVIGNFVSTGPSGRSRVASFMGAQDSLYRKELSTSVGGIPSSTVPQFQFTECSSTVMPSTSITNSDGSTTYYGLVRTNGNPDNCVTVAALGSSSTVSLLNYPCEMYDDTTLIDQWFSATEQTDNNGTVTSYQLEFVGKAADDSAPYVYDWTSFHRDNARLVGLNFAPDYPSRKLTGFSVAIRP
ncbi:hypothetical protein CF327_g6914 [Tilletia walkeri]|uniref:Ubiquitin 3 binding protein But2 C-terminal domain-containing protein n=1 Tax=Tilletia walkeri TaxID=117179 RepID=A0A8X7N3X3_9BASI|nr:hypothetical protein CF327_g6914 [Tilletia walkeri]KAE8265952.1 hypothetical protein A4X09_0g6398 [Tilletia walkeri]